MIAVAVSVLAGLYLLIPSLLFDKVVSSFVPAKKVARRGADEILYGLLVALIPFTITEILSHISWFVGHSPFVLPSVAYSTKWKDYHDIALALSSDSYFKEKADTVWVSVSHAWRHQARFLFWMYVILVVQISLWITLLRNYGRLQRFRRFGRILKWFSRFLIGRVSEWHVLLTTFVFDPAEQRTVYADIVTKDGLFKGKIRNYFTTNDGALVGILLDETYRFRKKELDEVRTKWRDSGSKDEKPRTENFWTKIAGGTHLYIPADQIGNLNVRYEKPPAIQKKEILKSINREESLRNLVNALKSQSRKLTITFRATDDPTRSTQAASDSTDSPSAPKEPEPHEK